MPFLEGSIVVLAIPLRSSEISGAWAAKQIFGMISKYTNTRLENLASRK